MLKTNSILSVTLLLSIPVVGMENPAAGHKDYQQIFAAARLGNLAELQTVIRNNPGINLGQLTDRGLPLILITAMQGKVDIMHYLLRVLALNPEVVFNGQNALHLASSRGQLEMVKYLVEMAKFDINAKDIKGRTALDLAKEQNKTHIVKYLSTKIAKKARPLPPTPAKPATQPATKKIVKPATKSCVVCVEDRQPDQFVSLGCGHEYCRECLGFMLDTAIKDKNTTAFKCPNPDCKQPLENDLHKISADRDKIAEFSEIQLKEYLTKQETTKNCPTPNCGFSFINERADQFTHKCPDCKAEYCGKCLHGHSPITSCAQAERDRNLANDKNAQERANQQWLEQNTKPCPRCGTRTEKNGGCMHMKCRNCEYHYCWNCLGEFVNHPDFYSCQNRTQNPLAPQAQQPQHEQEYSTQNAHLFFARDPRGFVNSYNINITKDFAERFMRLSCEAQGEWTARIEQIVADDVYTYQNQMAYHWTAELERLEPFALTNQIYQPTQEGTFLAEISANRQVGNQIQNQITQWIIEQNPNDLIMFRGWINGILYCETSLSRERLQDILNQATRHFRNNREVQQAPALVRPQPVQNNLLADEEVPFEEAPIEEQPLEDFENEQWHEEPAAFEEQPDEDLIRGYISGEFQQIIAGRLLAGSITISFHGMAIPNTIENYARILRTRLDALNYMLDNLVIRGNTIVLINNNQIHSRDLVERAIHQTNQRFMN